MRAGLAWPAVVALLTLTIVTPAAGAAPKTVALVCGPNPALLLDEPGSYTVKTAVDGCNSATLIRIAASDVTLDLGGRMLSGHSTNCLEGIHVDAGLKRIEIRNGAISRCNIAIRSEAHGPTVRKVVAFDNDQGMDVKVGRFVKNVVAHSAGVGMTDDSGGTFVGNTIVSNIGRGIDSNGTKLVKNNTIVDSVGFGIAGGSGGRIEGNRLLGNSGAGMFLEDGTITANTSIGSGGSGIYTEGDPVVTGNRAVGNGDMGIYTEGASAKLESNRAFANAQTGLRLGSSARAVDNRAGGNLAYGITAGDSATIKQNLASGNISLGIDAGATPSGLGTNKAAYNNLIGIQCDPDELCTEDHSLDDAQTVFVDCSSFTTLLSLPGNYVLRSSRANCAHAGNAILITSDDVTLDLNGYRIDGIGQLAAAVAVADGLENVVVRNGVVSDYGFGVTTGNSQVRVEDVVAVRNVHAGITAGDGAQVRGNTVIGTTGVASAGMILATGAKAIGNTVAANANEGIRVDSGPVTIKDNEISGNGDGGIAAFDTDGNTVTGNQLIGNGWVSIRVRDNNTISGNVITGSIDYPIEAGDGNTITRNKVIGNSGGISVDENNTVTENTVKANDGSGIFVGTGSTVARNTASGNTDNGITTAAVVAINDNTVIGNGGWGIEAGSATGSGNVAKHNGQSGQCFPVDLC